MGVEPSSLIKKFENDSQFERDAPVLTVSVSARELMGLFPEITGVVTLNEGAVGRMLLVTVNVFEIAWDGFAVSMWPVPSSLPIVTKRVWEPC